MTIVTCPRCRDEVTVPTHASDQVVVRCPLCAEEYPLETALRTVPPMLIVVGSTASAAELPGDDLRLAEIAEPSTPRPIRQPAVSARASRGRPHRREKSFAFELVKILAGGVIGLSIGQLILWWMPGDWDINKRDPAKLVPRLSPYVPWLIPSALRESAGTDLSAAALEDAPRSGREGTRRPLTGRSSQIPNEPPLLGSADGITEDSPDFSERFEYSSAQGNDLAESPLAGSDVDSGTRGAFGQTGSDADSVEPPPDTAAVAFRSPPTLDPAQIQLQLDTVKQALEAWSNQNDAAAADAVWAALGNAAQVLTFADQTQPDEVVQDPAAGSPLEAVIQQIKQLVQDPKRRETLSSAAQPPMAEELPPGVVAVGIVEPLEMYGTAIAIPLRLPNDELLTIVSDRVLPHLRVGGEALAVGVPVGDPQTELTGFEGTASQVVFSRLLIPLSATP